LALLAARVIQKIESFEAGLRSCCFKSYKRYIISICLVHIEFPAIKLKNNQCVPDILRCSGVRSQQTQSQGRSWKTQSIKQSRASSPSLNPRSRKLESHSIHAWACGRIVVVGGVAGLEVATALGKLKSESIDTVTLVDSDSAHVWKPMLHTIAAGTRDLAQQQTTYLPRPPMPTLPTSPARCAAWTVRLASFCWPPFMPRWSRAGGGAALAYDKLVIAVGSGANDFGTPGVHEHCFMIDSRRKADAFNQEIRLRMVRCMTSGEQLQVAIVGGGATGLSWRRAGSACRECHGRAWARPPSSASC
jgi:hypothetical protein